MPVCSLRPRRSNTTRSLATVRSRPGPQSLASIEAVKLLEATLAEEKKTDETLTKLAQSEVNQHAQAA